MHDICNTRSTLVLRSAIRTRYALDTRFWYIREIHWIRDFDAHEIFVRTRCIRYVRDIQIVQYIREVRYIRNILSCSFNFGRGDESRAIDAVRKNWNGVSAKHPAVNTNFLMYRVSANSFERVYTKPSLHMYANLNRARCTFITRRGHAITSEILLAFACNLWSLLTEHYVSRDKRIIVHSNRYLKRAFLSCRTC